MGEQGKFYFRGARDGTVVRVLASHQCGPGSNPGVDAICGFVVGSLLCSERFFSRYSGFPSPKTLLFIIYLCGHLGRILWFTCVSMYHFSLIKLYKIKLYKVTSLSLYMYAAI